MEGYDFTGGHQAKTVKITHDQGIKLTPSELIEAVRKIDALEKSHEALLVLVRGLLERVVDLEKRHPNG